MTNYRLRKLGHWLKTKRALILGKTCSGKRWPEGEHYWIVDDTEEQKTYHVLVNKRPTWERYCPDPDCY